MVAIRLSSLHKYFRLYILGQDLTLMMSFAGAAFPAQDQALVLTTAYGGILCTGDLFLAIGGFAGCRLFTGYSWEAFRSPFLSFW